MIIKGKGQLQHHFWGDYSATVRVWFDTEADATAALPHLPGFSQVENVLGFHGKDKELKAVEDKLVSLGAQRKRIGSLKHSIDYGEIFTFKVPLVKVHDVPTKVNDGLRQLSLMEDYTG